MFRRDSVGGECLRADRYVRETPLNLLTPSFFLVMKPITSQARLGTRHTRRSKLSERSTVCVIRRDAALRMASTRGCARDGLPRYTRKR